MKEAQEFELEVHQLNEDDVLKSMIRIDRRIVEALGLRLHGLCEVRSSETDKRLFVQARTVEPKHKIDRRGNLPVESWILMDEELRNRLGVAAGESHNFALRSIGRKNLIRNLRYLADHEDPVVRITFWLAMFSVAVGVVLGILPVLVPIIT